MSGRGGFKRNRRGNEKNETDSQNDSKNVKEVDESSPVIQMFRQCQLALDSRHDKHERLVKLSRDITIDSKRTIFQLHRISGSSDPAVVLQEAEDKLKEIQQTKWRSIAVELYSEDPYQFLRAYSPGLQEYIEAISFWHYLKEKDLISLEDVEKDLQFDVDSTMLNQGSKKENSTVEEADKSSKSDETTQENIPTSSDTDSSMKMRISVHIPPVEYMLGIADLTGELMRMAIYSVGSGDLSVPFELSTFMRVIHDAFVLFGNIQRELPRKLSTLKASLRKVETACYTLQVRGSEIPKHMLKDVFSSSGSGHGIGEFDEYVGSGD